MKHVIRLMHCPISYENLWTIIKNAIRITIHFVIFTYYSVLSTYVLYNLCSIQLDYSNMIMHDPLLRRSIAFFFITKFLIIFVRTIWSDIPNLNFLFMNADYYISCDFASLKQTGHVQLIFRLGSLEQSSLCSLALAGGFRLHNDKLVVNMNM